MPWRYEPGDKRKKHKWAKDYAGFEVENGVRVGKCSSKITLTLAESLLNSGIPWNNPSLPKDYPHNIYNVYEGAIYKAAITLHGVSYHGFPADKRVPREVLGQLRKLAKEKECLEEFEEWVKQHITL